MGRHLPAELERLVQEDQGWAQEAQSDASKAEIERRLASRIGSPAWLPAWITRTTACTAL